MKTLALVLVGLWAAVASLSWLYFAIRASAYLIPGRARTFWFPVWMFMRDVVRPEGEAYQRKALFSLFAGVPAVALFVLLERVL